MPSVIAGACLLPATAAFAHPLAADNDPAPDPIMQAAARGAAGMRAVDSANAVMIRAISLVGTPYAWGGARPGGFDCSGLVNYVFRDMLGISLPRTSRELAAAPGPRVEPQALRTGDLVFFGEDGVVSHVGIYVGDGRFVHAPRTGTVVRLERIDNAYWMERYLATRRVIAP